MNKEENQPEGLSNEITPKIPITKDVDIKFALLLHKVEKTGDAFYEAKKELVEFMDTLDINPVNECDLAPLF